MMTLLFGLFLQCRTVLCYLYNGNDAWSLNPIVDIPDIRCRGVLFSDELQLFIHVVGCL